MIKYINVSHINNRANIDSKLNPDINILTGLNGCGKTTVLKLIWYSMSSNLERIFQECSFRSFHIETDNGYITILPQYNDNEKIDLVKVTSQYAREVYAEEIPYDKYEDKIEVLNKIWFKNRRPTALQLIQAQPKSRL